MKFIPQSELSRGELSNRVKRISRGQHRRWIQTAYVVIDLVGVWGILFFLHAVRFDGGSSNSFSHFLQSDYSVLSVFQTFFFPLLLGYYGQYGTSRGNTRLQEWLKVGKAITIASLATLAMTIFLKIEDLSRLVLASGLVLDFVYCAGWRTLKRGVVRKWVSEGYNNERTLIVGAGKVGNHLAKSLAAHPELGVRVIGFLDDRRNGDEILGKLGDFRTIMRREFVDSVYITIPSQRDAVKQLLAEAKRENVSIRIIPEFFDLRPAQISAAYADGVPYLMIDESPIPIGGLLVKKLMDFVVGSLGLIVLSPVLCAIGVAIRIDSRGPVLYSANRVGYKGKSFKCFKFRTMICEADEIKDELRKANKRQGATFKIENDPRITRVGRILRRFSIDEVPQLINVIKGEMSLVGPRPHPLDDFERYSLSDLRRLEVRPGMTGLWQVRARHDPSFRSNVRYDLFYIDHWSLGLDFWILLQTLPSVIRGEGE